MSLQSPSLPFLQPGEAFPPTEAAWGSSTPAAGLLACGGALDLPTLRAAYSQGIFPWFSEGQPILWWSPDPRMVLKTVNFRLHRSLARTVDKFRRSNQCEIRIDFDFTSVIQACARSSRRGKSSGTWIVPDMVEAYTRLHEDGIAHSVETWVDSKLVGGLYCVGLGKAVFGESMFTNVTDASKIALCALVCFCREHGILQVDCQQNTHHLASLGARETSRAEFVRHVQTAQMKAAPTWLFDPLYWENLTPSFTTDS
jgi:leucyl/phenylalanyl-tRNA---protein transferase